MSEDDTQINRDAYGGPINSDVSYLRGSGAILRFNALSGVTCHNCGSGEVHQPMQTMDMPILLKCLECGKYAPSKEFQRIG